MGKLKKKRDPIDFESRVISRGDLNRRDGQGRLVFMGVEETALDLGLSKGEVLMWLRNGEVPHFVLENRVFFHRSELPGNEAPNDMLE